MFVCVCVQYEMKIEKEMEQEAKRAKLIEHTHAQQEGRRENEEVEIKFSCLFSCCFMLFFAG